LWPSILLVEETRVPGEKHWPVASHYNICCMYYIYIQFLSISMTCGRSVVFFLLVSSTNKTNCQNITEILLKVVLNTIILTLFNLNTFVFQLYW
jgi:hypothetical protein